MKSSRFSFFLPKEIFVATPLTKTHKCFCWTTTLLLRNRSFSYYDRHETQLLVLHFDFFKNFLCKCSYKTYKFEQSYSQMQSTVVLPYSIVKYFVISHSSQRLYVTARQMLFIWSLNFKRLSIQMVILTKQLYEIHTAQKVKFSIIRFFSKCDQIRRKLCLVHLPQHS